MALERCRKCVLPVTWETVWLDDDGVCNICRNWEEKDHNIDWNERENEFKELVKKVKSENRQYDCILPYSGGKDSTYTLLKVVESGLKPLVVSFDHGFYRPTMIENRIRTIRRLGVDFLSFTPNWRVVKKIMLESLIRRGDFCWHCHAGVFVYPMQIAVKYDIPLVIWGEGGGEYENYFRFSELEQTDEWKYNRRIIMGIRAEDMAGFIGEDIKELECFVYPTKEELSRVGVKSLPLGKFFPWDVKKQVEIIKNELGWKEDMMESCLPGEKTYEKIECMFEGVRDYIKFLKRGFARMTHLTTLDIKHGRMDREEAMKLVKKFDGRKPHSLEKFLEYLDISEDEFHRIAAMHLIHPNEPIDPNSLEMTERLWDQEMWFSDREEEK